MNTDNNELLSDIHVHTLMYIINKASFVLFTLNMSVVWSIVRLCFTHSNKMKRGQLVVFPVRLISHRVSAVVAASSC